MEFLGVRVDEFGKKAIEGRVFDDAGIDLPISWVRFRSRGK